MPSKTHGESQIRFYGIWSGVVYRSTRKKLQKSKRCYKNVGIDKAWLKYENFKKDMLESYEEHVKIFGENDTTIDRINSKRNYSKKNCRWATRKEQMNHTSRNIFVTYKGEKKTLTEWGKIFSRHPQSFKNRLDRGMSIEDIFEKPFMKRRFVMLNNKKMSINEAAKKENLTPQAIFHRIKVGSIKEVF